MGNSQPKQKSLSETVIEIRMARKQLDRASKKAMAEHEADKKKVVTAVKKGNLEGARVHANNAIRKKHESQNFLKMSSQMDQVASQLNSADLSNQMTKLVTGTVPQLQSILAGLTPEKMAIDMEKFEKVLEDLNIRSDYMSDAIASGSASTTPMNEVDALIQGTCEAQAIDTSELFAAESAGLTPAVPTAVPQPAAAGGGSGAAGGQSLSTEEAELERRLKELRS